MDLSNFYSNSIHTDIKNKKKSESVEYEFEDGYGKRPDGSEKGAGFLGLLKRPDGRISTEISISLDEVNGGKDFPLIVPTLSKEEIQVLLSLDEQAPDFFDKLPKSVVDKAIAHANKRLKEGKSVFADDSESPK